MSAVEAAPDEHAPDAGARAAAVRAGLSVGVAVGVSGLAFGAAAVTAGLTVTQACVLSLLTFTGASQFALAGVIGGGGGLVAGTLGAVLLGGRNALYGMRLARTLRVRGWRRLVTAHVVIDETAAVATAQRDPAAARAGFHTTAISLYLAWNATTLLGAAGTARLGDPDAIGLDVLGPAAFLALLWPRLTGARGGAPAERRSPVERAGREERSPALKGMTGARSGDAAQDDRTGPDGGQSSTHNETPEGRWDPVRVAVGAVVIAVVATPLLPPGIPVMLAAVAALPALLRRRTP